MSVTSPSRLRRRVCVHQETETRGLTHPVAQGGRSSRLVPQLDWIRYFPQGPGHRPLVQRETPIGNAIPPISCLPTGTRASLVPIVPASFEADFDTLLYLRKCLSKLMPVCDQRLMIENGCAITEDKSLTHGCASALQRSARVLSQSLFSTLRPPGR